MQNDVLKNNIAPWQENGRWYHGIVDYSIANLVAADTDPFLINSCNLYVSGAGHIVLTPKNKKDKLIDAKYVNINEHNYSGTGTNVGIGQIRIDPNGVSGIVIGYSASNISSGKYHIFVFVKHSDN